MALPALQWHGPVCKQSKVALAAFLRRSFIVLTLHSPFTITLWELWLATCDMAESI